MMAGSTNRALAWQGVLWRALRGEAGNTTDRLLPVIGQAVVERVFCRRFRVLLVTWLR